jgi:hypothetical protein
LNAKLAAQEPLNPSANNDNALDPNLGPIKKDLSVVQELPEMEKNYTGASNATEGGDYGIS